MPTPDLNWRVVVIGAACLDIKGRLAEPLLLGTSNAGRLTISVGGVARNIAENLARLGADTTLIAAVGADEFGQLIMSQTEEAGVRTEAMLIIEDQHTAAYLALLDHDGLLHTALDDSDCVRALTPEYLLENSDLIRAADVVFIDANLRRASADVIRAMCAEEGIPLCLEPVAYGLATRYRDRLQGLYVITPNEREAEALTGMVVSSPAEATRARPRSNLRLHLGRPAAKPSRSITPPPTGRPPRPPITRQPVAYFRSRPAKSAKPWP